MSTTLLGPISFNFEKLMLVLNTKILKSEQKISFKFLLTFVNKTYRNSKINIAIPIYVTLYLYSIAGEMVHTHKFDYYRTHYLLNSSYD